MNDIYQAEQLRSFIRNKNNEIEWSYIRGQIKSAFGEFWKAILYSVIPRVSEVKPPADPPEPVDQVLSDDTLIQCKEIYERIEVERKYLNEKARSIFTIITFLSPTLITAIAFLVLKSNRHESMWVSAIVLFVISFILLFLGFISTARALAVQGRVKLWLESVIDLDIHRIRPYDKIRHAQGMLYCASVNSSYNTHISQCVKSAHILTTLAVIIATIGAITLIMNLEVQPGEIKTAENINPIVEKINETTPINLRIREIQADLAELKAAVNLAEKIQNVDVQLNTLNNKVNILVASQISEKKLTTGRVIPPKNCGAQK